MFLGPAIEENGPLAIKNEHVNTIAIGGGGSGWLMLNSVEVKNLSEKHV